MTSHSDILIVGAGPAGLSFAAEMAGSGLGEDDSVALLKLLERMSGGAGE